MSILHTKKLNWQDKTFRIVAIVISVLVIVIGSIRLMFAFSRRSSLLRQEAELVEKIEAKKQDIAKIVDCQRRFKSDSDFVERIARQNRRVFPGELVFIFENK